MSGAALAAAAEALEGTRFRLHGRDPTTGLDCIGVLVAALAEIGRSAPLPNGYRLRMRAVAGLAEMAAASGLAEVCGEVVPGDVLLLRPSPCQFHLAIAASGGRFVHAHAGVRRVVVASGPIGSPIAGHWRL